MPKKSEKSIEQYVKQWFITKLTENGTEFKSEQDYYNVEIERALRDAPSKSGGSGPNRPDFQMLLIGRDMQQLPVMIEAKGSKAKLEKTDENGTILNRKMDGSPNYSNISSYAVNGAVHYASAVVENSESYPAALAVGINGYENVTGENVFECAIYYISKTNAMLPKQIGKDISLLFECNHDELFRKIAASQLTEVELENLARESENLIETNLKDLNQLMHDDLNISVGARVKLITGMIMAGLGVPKKCSPLDVTELQGNTSADENDGQRIMTKIKAFLREKSLPDDKRDMILADLQGTFLNRGLWEPINGESRLKQVYAFVKEKIIPYINPEKSTYLDFTGKLFNVLTDWVDIPDGGKNDVVLTPRYVTDMMAKLCRVNRDSYVWDYATGTAGFLVSSMKLMLQDAEQIENIKEREEKKSRIRGLQLLGVEKRPDIYLLGVLNMILMGDGTSNIIQADSLTEFDGKYAQGVRKGEDFLASVFLLNPPYSSEGKGFIFAEKAMNRMTHGRAAILIQENAGSGNGMPFTERLLRRNTLVASIHMADIFRGKAGVQTAVYVFDVGIPHDPERNVLFIDMSEDGYARQNRKKASAATNLKNADHAPERYQEVIDLVLGREPKTHFYKEGETVFRDKISLSGTDWTVNQHKKWDAKPTIEDFKKTVAEYLSWKVGQIIKNGAVNG